MQKYMLDMVVGNEQMNENSAAHNKGRSAGPGAEQISWCAHTQWALLISLGVCVYHTRAQHKNTTARVANVRHDRYNIILLLLCVCVCWHNVDKHTIMWCAYTHIIVSIDRRIVIVTIPMTMMLWWAAIDVILMDACACDDDGLHTIEEKLGHWKAPHFSLSLLYIFVCFCWSVSACNVNSWFRNRRVNSQQITMNDYNLQFGTLCLDI